MKNLRVQNIFCFLLIFLFNGCEEKIETEHNSELLIGYWINPQIVDSLVTFSKSSKLVDANYGIAFHSDGSFIERNNSGWCATPPISYSNFKGSWVKNDSLVIILVDYWGGIARYQWKIIDVGDNKLVVNKIKVEYNYDIGKLKNYTGLDGCGWIIELADESRLEPINLDLFDLQLAENKEIIFKYHQRTDLGSYCMIGKVIEIDEIIDLTKM
ncbi:hypothetical protein [Natronoflexus pectinivorans]|uniref:Lipocalin-like protein n=1 Tax=Natronoflexus pectinivorans TaxID=682526 RepID=A0A4R2GLQ5_9BACT|nr:hypothetical protein [Natronoflexus pectinivorans]TCO09637.1 hypothetical protein EV194_10257 [Natronoflexus pectinivorans]